MSDEIYVMWQFNTSEKRRDLTKKERDGLYDSAMKSTEEVGGKVILYLVPLSGKREGIFITSFPDLEAYVTHTKATGFGGLDIGRYWPGETTICKRTDAEFDTSQIWEKDYLPDGIYVFDQYRSTEKIRDLTKKEIEEFRSSIWKCFEEAGGKSAYFQVLSGKWESIRISAFPNLEAYVTYRKATGFGGLDVGRYTVGETTICKKPDNT